MDTLDELQIFCESAQRTLQEFCPPVLQYITVRTRSTIGLLSVVDIDHEGWLRCRARHNVGVKPSKGRFSQGFSVPIGATELPRRYRSLSGYVAHSRQAYRCGDVRQDPYYLPMDPDICSELVVPILRAGRLIGVLNVESPHLQWYTAEDTTWLCTVADLIAGPLESLLSSELPAPAIRPVLHDITACLLQPGTTSHEFLWEVLRQMTTVTGADCAFARLVDATGLVLVTMYSPGGCRMQLHEALVLSIGGEELPVQERSFAGYVASIRQAARLGDVTQTSYYRPLNPHMQSILGAPILFRETVLGVITLLSAQKDFFTVQDEIILRTVTDLIAMPLSGLLMKERFRRPMRVVREEISKTLEATEGDEFFASSDVSDKIARQTAEALESQLCTIWLLNPAGTKLTLHGTYGLGRLLPGAGQAPPTEESAQQALYDALGLPLLASGPTRDINETTPAWQAVVTRTIVNCGPNRDRFFARTGVIHPFLVAPILVNNHQPIGVIHVGLKERTTANPHGAYSEADEHILDIPRGSIARAFEHYQLRRVAEHAAQDLHDALGLITYDILYGIDQARSAALHRCYDQVELALDRLEHQAQALNAEIRAILKNLQTHSLEQVGLGGALERYIHEHVERPGLTVHLHAPQTNLLPIHLAWQLYRIAQEALTNIIKHAQATEVQCAVDIGATTVQLRVRDNGRGFVLPAPASMDRRGLGHMHERVMTLGGKLKVWTEVGQGTTITASVPLHERP